MRRALMTRRAARRAARRATRRAARRAMRVTKRAVRRAKGRVRKAAMAAHPLPRTTHQTKTISSDDKQLPSYCLL